MKTFVIVGAGLAGAKAAETLRSEGFDGRIVLVGAEDERPYERPPLSKSYLGGDSSIADARVHDKGFYESNEIELITGKSATRIDVAAHAVELDGGRRLNYDRLLLATGSTPRRPPLAGADLDGVHILRTAAEARALREAILAGGRLAVIGAGWIGSEVAATARGLGADVTLIARAATPLERVFGQQLGAFFADTHRAHDVDVRTGAGVSGIEGDTRARRVRLADGSAVECDAVLLSVGAAPATELAAAAGLDVDDGIVVDAHLRTSARDVFAAGDVASAHHPRYDRRIRVEHWANAADQGAAAARNMLGAGEEYSQLPYFFSDQYDLGLEYVGLHGPADHLSIDGKTGEGQFRAFWIARDGRVSAGMHVNDWDAIDTIRAAVESGTPADFVAAGKS
jgi:3-phenylpropionate/trans-cinnamate dioxygenase ferredoxin reductase component